MKEKKIDKRLTSCLEMVKLLKTAFENTLGLVAKW